MHSIHCRDEMIFRSSSNFLGNVWRDWVIVDWGDEGKLPCHTMGFVELLSLSDSFKLNFGGVEDGDPGNCAIVECVDCLDEENNSKISDLFIPIGKEIGGFTGSDISHRKHCPVDVETFVAPVAVIPNLGGPPNHHFEVRERKLWAEDFCRWLEEPHLPPNHHTDSEEEEGDVAQKNFDDSINENGSTEEVQMFCVEFLEMALNSWKFARNSGKFAPFVFELCFSLFRNFAQFGSLESVRINQSVSFKP